MASISAGVTTQQNDKLHWLRVCLYNWTGFGQCHRGFYWAPPNVTSVTWSANSVDEIKEHIKFASVLFELYQISVVH